MKLDFGTKDTRYLLIIKSSFLFWGGVCSIFVGLKALLIGLVFFIFCCSFKSHNSNSSEKVSSLNLKILIAILISIVVFKLPEFLQSLSSFFSHDAVNKVIEDANNNISKGRSFFELFSLFTSLIPFIILDSRSQLGVRTKRFIYFLIVVNFIIVSGISRGMVSIIIISIVLPQINNLKKIVIFGSIFVLFYHFISIYRDGTDNNYIVNPVVDSFVFPGFNLALLNAKQVYLSSIDYISQFFLKFVPSFLFDKNIFSFNIEMTKIIYPFMGDEVSSISVFTYLGDLFVYKPLILTLIFSIIVVRFILKYIIYYISKYQFKITSIYIALYCFIALRSRIYDLLSTLILYLFLLIIIDVVNRIDIDGCKIKYTPAR